MTHHISTIEGDMALTKIGKGVEDKNVKFIISNVLRKSWVRLWNHGS